MYKTKQVSYIKYFYYENNYVIIEYKTVLV